MINLEQLKADREKGTDGPWEWKRLGDNAYGLAPDVINSLYNGTLLLSDTDAHRIARLPELEAAYIEAVELLEQAMDVVDHGPYYRIYKLLNGETK